MLVPYEWKELGISAIAEAPAKLDPTRPALVIADDVISYERLTETIGSHAIRLRGFEIERGTVIPVVDDASLISVTASLALARLGAAPALVNPRLAPPEIRALTEEAGCISVAISGESYRVKVTEALGETFLLLGSDQLDQAPVGKGPVRTRLRRPAGPASPAMAPPHPDDVALVLFTSGTTGVPKAVRLTHKTLVQRIADFGSKFDPGVPPAVSLMCVPLVHIGGMLGLMVALASGNTTVLQPRFDSGEWLELVERHSVSRAFVVPTMLQRILDHPGFAKRDLSSLKALSYGAAPAPPELVERAIVAFGGVALSNVFGQTETLGSVTVLGPEDHAPAAPRRRLASVGRPMKGVETRIVDPGTGEHVLQGQVGELWVRNVKDPSQGWIHTGDRVWEDGDGYLYPAGRLSDTINRAGEKFSPGEIEIALRLHPAVADAAVAGVPDMEMGSRVGAAVVLRNSVPASELRQLCKQHVANFKVPEQIAFVDELPRNDVGKIDRRRLIDLITAQGDDDIGEITPLSRPATS